MHVPVDRHGVRSGVGELTRVDPNKPTHAQLRVTMAEGAGPLDSDPLADAVVDLVLEAMGVEPARVGERVGAGPSDRRGSTRTLAVARAAPALERLEPLTEVAAAAERYRRAVVKGKGRKRARTRLFAALADWKALQGPSGGAGSPRR